MAPLRSFRHARKRVVYSPEARAGGDPSTARKQARKGLTVSEACDQFTKEHAARKKPHTQSQYETIIRRYVNPALGNRKIASINHGDIARLISSVGKDYPVMANRVRAMLSKLFDLAEKWGARPTNSNPVLHIERYSERKRHRDLSELELARLAKALEAAKRDSGISQAIDAIRLLLFTGMRRGEILRLRWSEVDLDRSALRLGDSKTGQKTVRLNSAACDLISAQERVIGVPYVFPSQQHSGTHLSEWELRKAWERVREIAALEGREDEELPAFRLHDFRHNFAATGTAQNFSLQIIGRLLGHKNPATTNRYADLQDDPARQAAETIGRKIAEAMKTENERRSNE
ncbi:MAG: site-specific integrase [Deltaproteobacteria bacterium]|nr:site-specific integrase [Deltaproteobacteria bacterium]